MLEKQAKDSHAAWICQVFTLLFVSIITFDKKVDAYVEVKNWAFHFPYGSNMGLYMALALPIDVPNENVFVAYNFEANYLLPNNYSENVEFPPLAEAERGSSDARSPAASRRLDRATFYAAIERKMDAYGYRGHDCLLRTICETAASHFDQRSSGVLGDVLHIILTPSSSKEKNVGEPALSSLYLEAEQQGQEHADCKHYATNDKCPISFLNFITSFI